MTLLTHFRLAERPFEATWDPRFFFRSAEHEEALQRLLYLVEETTMNMGAMSGGIGCGKTLTRAVFAGSLDPARFAVATVENSGFPLEGLLGCVLRQLWPGAEREAEGKMPLCEKLGEVADRIAQQRRHVVILLDEAQDMDPVSFRELRWLTNLNGGGRALLTLVLIGQPELRDLIADHPALDQRISLRFHLPPLRQQDLSGYLIHRLKTAGHATGALFTPAARELLWQASRGVPRQINRFAKLALETAWMRESPVVDGADVAAVLRDLSRHETLLTA